VECAQAAGMPSSGRRSRTSKGGITAKNQAKNIISRHKRHVAVTKSGTTALNQTRTA